MTNKLENNKPSGAFKKGQKINDWILDDWISSDGRKEKWLGHNINDKIQKEITLVPDDIAFLDKIKNIYDGDSSNLNRIVTNNKIVSIKDNIDDWKLIRKIASGASSEVWEACRKNDKENKDIQPVALKICTSLNQDEVDKFRQEANFLEQNKIKKGIVKLLEKKICEPNNGHINYSWYSMPIYVPMNKYLTPDSKLFEIVKPLKSAVDTLVNLAANGIYYYDFKISHILTDGNEYYLTDFGLAKILGKKSSETTLKEEDKFNKSIVSSVSIVLLKLLELYGFVNSDLEALANKHKDLALNKKALLKDFQNDINKWLSDNKNLNGEKSEDYLFKYANFLYNVGKFNESKQVTKKIIQGNNSNLNAKNLMALLELSFKNYDEAINYANEVIGGMESPVVGYNTLGCIYRAKGDYDKSIESFEKSLSFNPKYEASFVNLGIAKQQKLMQIRYDSSLMKAKEANHISMSDTDKDNLLRLFDDNYDIIGQSESRMLLQGKIDEKPGKDSYATLSWDQYFTDLSFGSFRDVKDGSRRAGRQRVWHYLFKNLSLIDRIFKTNKKEIYILDVGCSSAYFRRFLEGNASLVEDKKIYYVGLDVRYEFLHRAVYAIDDIESGAIGNYSQSAFILHDIKNGLPFNNGMFDFVVNFEMIKYLPTDLGVSLLNEFQRVLNDDGQLFLSTTHTLQRPGFIEGLNFKEFDNLLKDANLKVLRHYGSQAEFKKLYPNYNPEFKKIVNELLKYHPPEIVCAFLAPLTPEYCSQQTYHCMKIKN